MDMAAAASPACQTETPPPPPDEHRDWVDGLRRGGHALSSSAATLGHPLLPNSWSCPLPTAFSVRGADYQHTKAKIPGGDCLLHSLAFDFLQGPSPIAHIMQHPHCRVRTALDAAIRSNPQPQQQPFVWAFNLQLGNKSNHSLVFYYVSFSSPPQGSLMQRFLDGDDAFRNSRLKGLVNFPEAPSLVQAVVGERWPVWMVGKFMKCNYIREKYYIEVDVDVGSSMIMRTAMKLTFGLIGRVVADIAFVLEGIDPDELPERILGATRLVRPEPSFATHFDMSV